MKIRYRTLHYLLDVLLNVRCRDLLASSRDPLTSKFEVNTTRLGFQLIKQELRYTSKKMMNSVNSVNSLNSTIYTS